MNLKTFVQISVVLLATSCSAWGGWGIDGRLPVQTPPGAQRSAVGMRTTWMADNGNGTYSNPLFYDEFSDPDAIRIGDEFYLTGTTMHVMPGLPVLRSKDLVNWEFLGYALDKLDLGPECRLENEKDMYGQGIWAPCLRYHDGRFYIFANVNRHKTQMFTARDPHGPWTRTEMNVSLHDLSVLFDDDGKVYVVWGYDEIRIAELTNDLTDIRPGTEKIIIPKGTGAGEGSHFTKIDGRYFISMAVWDPVCYQVCARADQPGGPYEITLISSGEHLGVGTGWALPYDAVERRFRMVPPRHDNSGCTSMHQGPIVQMPAGDWWALSMMDHRSIGRLTVLSPVTWDHGWPYMGLPGNLTRTPLTWVKPLADTPGSPRAPYDRCDEFTGPKLKSVWQWNHVPVEKSWSLTDRPGHLSLTSLPARDLWHARNTLTQRAIGPASTVTTLLDATGLTGGDVAGLGLLNYPYAWVGVAHDPRGYLVRMYDQRTDSAVVRRIDAPRVWLRVECDFDTEFARFSYSADGTSFTPFGDPVIMAFQLRTFQGVRYALFNFNESGATGGTVAFDSFSVVEPRPSGLTTAIPCGETITLTSVADSSVLVKWKNVLRPVQTQSQFAQGVTSHFLVVDRGNGRVALRSVIDSSFITVTGAGRMSEVRCTANDGRDASSFQWTDIGDGTIALMSLSTHRYLAVEPHTGRLCNADHPGIDPDRKTGPFFFWAHAGN